MAVGLLNYICLKSLRQLIEQIIPILAS